MFAANHMGETIRYRLMTWTTDGPSAIHRRIIRRRQPEGPLKILKSRLIHKKNKTHKNLSSFNFYLILFFLVSYSPHKRRRLTLFLRPMAMPPRLLESEYLAVDLSS